MGRRRQWFLRIAVLAAILTWVVSPVYSQQSVISVADWEAHRFPVTRPATAIKAADLARARENAARYEWARAYVESERHRADAIVPRITPAYLTTMVEHTTPGGTGPCPACRAKGLPWHPNGQWSWSPDKPDQLTCRVCGTVFPNPEYPESIVLQSTWDPEQKFGFVGGEPFLCFGYQSRPSLTGIIRASKLNYVTNQLDTLARAYALTEDARYAGAARAILLRLAKVLPKYLVRAGYTYGEYADTDPHVAAAHIEDLPNDELVYPPNVPDRKLHTGYWSASRVGTSGMDGWWVCTVTQAYDLVCTDPAFSEADRHRIERDVLFESAYLATCDSAINNKSVGNRAGAAMVGLCTGYPPLVHFGLDGFRKTVEDWFLPDGGTSESPSYAMMTMSGVEDFGLMFRDYSDPPGYVPEAGEARLDHFDACRDTRYGDCWQDLLWTLQGDLHWPPSADSYRSTRLGAGYAELIAAEYPTAQHLALLQELTGGDLADVSPERAIFLREPGGEPQAEPSFALPDIVFPFLAQGYLRSGPSGRDGLVLLNASGFGNHHHLDSLDLYYWRDGHELLSDLGYLWDHPDSYQTRRTLSHNTVLVDGADQKRKGRGGSFHLFAVTPRVKAMEASSQAYDQASTYRRTVVQVDHGAAGSYLLDIFRVEGGETRQYVFHGPTTDYQARGLGLAPAPESLDLPLENVRQASGAGPWQVTWTLPEGYALTAFAPGSPRENVALGDGWGQRDHRNTDRGAKLPYLIRTCEGPGLDQFVTVFAGAPQGRALVTGVRLLALPAEAPRDAVAVEVATTEGADVIVSMLAPRRLSLSTSLGEVVTDGRLGVVLGAAGRPAAACLAGGTELSAGDARLTGPAARYAGRIIENASGPGESHYVLEGRLDGDQRLIGQALFVQDGTITRAYPIRGIHTDQARTTVFTKRDHAGFEARPGASWEVIPVVSWERD
jgi:hypothetical protein